MDIKEEILENKAKIRMAEKKIEALIKILTEEGIISKADLDEEIEDKISEEE